MAMVVRPETPRGAESDGSRAAWWLSPPRSAKEIFKSMHTKGTFHKTSPIKDVTKPDRRPGLAKLVEGKRVWPETMPLAVHTRRPPSVRPREVWEAPLMNRPVHGTYPRAGSPRSLMYHNPVERNGAKLGWGDTGSFFCSTRAPSPWSSAPATPAPSAPVSARGPGGDHQPRSGSADGRS